MNKVFTGSIFFILLLGMWYFFSLNQEQTFVETLNSYKITVSDIEDFYIEKETQKGVVATFDDKRIVVNIFKDFKNEDAKKYIEEQYILFNGIFEPQLPPYPEFLTRETGCGEKFLPVKNSGENGDYYVAFAGQRFGFGICVDDLVEYKASIKFLYCPNTKILAKFEYFVPNRMEFSDLENITESFRCI